MIEFSKALRGICAVEAVLDDAAESLEGCLRRFGPVARHRCESFDEVVEWLMPLASFGSRYLLVPWSGWTLILKNQPEAAAVAELLPISKAASSRAVHASWADEGRFWRVASGGREFRSIACYDDGGRWVFHQQGEPLPFERSDLHTKKRKKDRLPPELVHEYIGALLGVQSPPDWRQLLSGEVVCLERSTHELQVRIKYFETKIDI